MNTPEDGGHAFPADASTNLFSRGMSLRDYFAAKALVECIRVADGQMTRRDSLLTELFDKAAAYAYYAADAMLKARSA